MIRKKIVLFMGIMALGLAACGKKEGSVLSNDSNQEFQAEEKYEEYHITTSQFEDTDLSIKIPKEYLVYGTEPSVNGQSYFAIFVNEGTNEDCRQMITVTVKTKPTPDYTAESEYEYWSNDPDAGEIIEKDGVYVTYSNYGDEEHRCVATFRDVGNLLVNCKWETVVNPDSSVTYEDLEKAMEEIVFEEVEKPETETTEAAPESEETESSLAEEEIPVETQPQSEEETIEVVEVYSILDYPDDDWRCAGFYVDGKFAKLPMTYEELKELGFAEKIEITNSSRDVTELMIPAYTSNTDCSFVCQNSDGEGLYVNFVNTTAEEQKIENCIIYRIQLINPDDENRSGYGELPDTMTLCNGIGFDSTYEEVIALMGEPDKVSDLSSYIKDGVGFNGSLTYYFEEGNRKRYLEMTIYDNVVNGITIWVPPIDADFIIEW